MSKTCGSPASAVRPEGSLVWVLCGTTAAVTFVLFGWPNWEGIQPSKSATLVIILNLSIILTSTLILHLGFFGRIISLYRRNLQRVQCLTILAEDTGVRQIDAWWNLRNFVLNEDLALDYDIGGLAVSATFVLDLLSACVLAVQIHREGLVKAVLESPGT